ncbi:methylmalonyl-CoA mutase family protein [Caulobacter segnis]
MNVCSYHLQEAGATPVQELSYALAIADLRCWTRCRDDGQVLDERASQIVVARISFFVNAGRAVRHRDRARCAAFCELWDEIAAASATASRTTKARRFRYGRAGQLAWA